MSDVLRELIVKIQLEGAAEATSEEKKLAASTDKATKQFKDQGKETEKLDSRLIGISKTLGNISTVLAGMVIAKTIGLAFQALSAGFNTVSNTVSRAIDEAASTEQGLRNLSTALSITGEDSESAMSDMVAFANSMQDTTTASAGLTVSLLSQVKALGVSNAQAKQIVQTGIDFAAATGKDIPTAVDAIANSLNGMTKEVQKYVPEIKNLTDEQLKAGAAVDLLNKRFSGSAAKNLNTYAGAATQLSNVWADVFSTIGEPITKSLIPIFKEIVATIKSLMPSFANFGNQIAQAFRIVHDAFFGAFDIESGAKRVIDNVGKFIVTLALLIEDFFLFLRGEPSYLGEITGAGNFGELVGALVAKGVEELPKKIAPLLVDTFKQVGTVILDAVFEFLFTIVRDLFLRLTEDIPAYIKHFTNEVIRSIMPFGDAVAQGLTGGMSIGLGVGNEETDYIQDISDSFTNTRKAIRDFLPKTPSTLDLLKKIAPKDSPIGMLNELDKQEEKKQDKTKSSTTIDITKIVPLAQSAIPAMDRFAERMQPNISMAPLSFANTVAKQESMKSEAILPGDQTLNRNDQRSYTNNLDIKINTNAPAQAIQNQVNSLYFNQQLSGGN